MAYTQEEQVEIVHNALALETAIMVEKNDVQLLKEQRFERFPSYEEVFAELPPAKPQRRIATRVEAVEPIIPDPPKSDYSFGTHLKKRPYFPALFVLLIIIGAWGYSHYYYESIVGAFMVLTGIGCPAVLIWALVSSSKEKRRQDEKLANSPDYLAAVEQAKKQAEDQQMKADLQAQQQQEAFDTHYAEEMERYETVLVPQYEQQVEENKQEYVEMQEEYAQEKSEWEEKRADAVVKLGEDILANSKALEELYGTTRIISLHYREIPILQWLYDDMRSSDHDIRYATELLDRDRQRIATMEAGQRTAAAADRLFDEVHQLGTGIMQLQGVQIEGLKQLESEVFDILRLNEQIQISQEAMRETSRQILFHQRVNTAEIGIQEWRRHKAKKALRG